MASITTTISVRDKATQKYKEIHKELLRYQQQHKKTVSQIDKDNKELAKSENKLKNQIDSITSQKQKALRDIASKNALLTKQEKKESKERIEQAKELYKSQTATEKQRVEAFKTLMNEESRFARSHYNEKIAQRKKELQDLQKTNNIKRKESEDLVKTQQQNIEKLKNNYTRIGELEKNYIEKAKTLIEEDKQNRANESKEAQRRLKQRVKTYKQEKEEAKNTWNKIEEINRTSQSQLFKDKQSALQKRNELDKKQKKEEIKLANDTWNKIEEINRTSQGQIFKEKQKNLKKEKELRKQFESDFVNSAEQNQFNRAKEKLQKLEAQGIISSKERTEALEKQKKQIDLNTKSTSNLTNSVVRHLRQIETLVVAYYTLSRGFTFTIGKGIEVNRMIEDNTNGIAALLSANTQMVLSNGQVVNSYEKFKIGQKVATDAMQSIKKASVDTYATFPQLTEIFQQAIGQTLSMGDSFGTTVDEITKNTIKLSQRMSNIGGAIGQPMDRIREEIRSLLSGNASTDSLIATMIFGSPSEANEAIRKAKESGTNGLKNMLDSYLGTFDVLEGVDTYSRAVLNLQNSWDSAMQSIVQKSGAFNDIKNTFNDMANMIETDTESLVSIFDGLYNNIKKAFSFSDEIAKMTLLIVGTAGFVPAVNAASKAVLAFNVSALTMTGTLSALAKNIKKVRLGWAGLVATVGSVTFADEIEKSINKIKQMTPGWRDEVEKVANAVEKKQLPAVKKLNKLLEEQSNLKRILNITPDNVRAKEELKAIADKIKLQNTMVANQKQSIEMVDSFKKQGELLTKENVDKKFIQDAIEANKNAEDRVISFKKEIKEAEKNLSKLGKVYNTLFKAGDEAGLKKTKNEINELAEFIQNKEKEIAEVKQKESKKYQAIQDKEIAKREKSIKLNAENKAIQKEIELIEKGNVSAESRKIALSELKLNSLAEEFSFLTKVDDKNKVRLQILKEGLRYEELLTNEKEKQNREIEKQNKKIEDTFKKLSKDLKFKMEIEFDDIEGVSKNFSKISNIVNEITKENKAWNKETKAYNKLVDYAKKNNLKYSKEEKEYNEDKKQHQQNQIAGYANIAGAMSSMFAQGSKEAEAFQRIQAGIAMVSGITAVLEQAKGDPYTSFARMATMAATVATLLGNAGIAFSGIGGEKTTTTYDEFSKMKENTGTGSILGDAEATSQSITNSLNILENFALPQYQTLSQMNKYLASIDSKMGGVASLLIRQGGFAFGEGYTGAFDTGFKNNISIDGALGGVLFGSAGGLLDNLINKIPIVGDINKMFGGIVNSVLGGLFGKTSVSQSMTDAGITFGNQLLSQALENFEGQAYQTIKTVVTKKSWFSKSTSVSYKSYFQGLDSEIERQFQLVINSIYDTVVTAGSALDTSASEIDKSLEDFVVSIGKISLKGKSGDKIQETISSIFGKMSDDIVQEAFPALQSFQKVGEGLFETLTRVATGSEEAEYYISRLGSSFADVNYQAIINKQGDVGFEALLQSISQTETAVYGANGSLLEIIENLSGTAEELYTTYTALDGLRDRLKFLSHDINGLTSQMIYGAGSVEALASGFESYFENYLTEGEKVAYQTSQMQKEFQKLNIQMPTSKDGFKDIINGIDLTTEAGQELYGRLIILSSGFSEVAEKTQESIEKLKESLNEELSAFESIVKGVSEISDSFKTAIKTISGTIDTLLGNQAGSNTANKQLEKYWEKRAELETYLSKGSNVSTSEIETIKTLVTEITGMTSGIQSNYSDNTLITSNLTEDLKDIEARLNFSNKSLEQIIQEGMQKLATEDTLSDLTEYSKLMLHEQQKALEGETAALSSKTLTYGDYIGKQEKIDIATKLGTSFESAEPLIKSIQNLSVSKDVQGDVNKLLGYEGGINYDTNKASQIMNLSEYLSEDVLGAVSGVQAESSEKQKIAEQKRLEKEDFYARYNLILKDFKEAKTKADLAKNAYIGVWKNSASGDNGARINEDYEKGIAYKIISPPYVNLNNLQDHNTRVSRVYNPYLTEFGEAREAYNKLQVLEAEKTLKGYKYGGYTGKGNKHEVRGVTHANEHVVTSDEVDAIGGANAVRDMLDRELAGENIKTVTPKPILVKSNDKDGIIAELKENQKILQKGFELLSRKVNELIDQGEERRSENFRTEVYGTIKAIAG